ncbi:RES family NAD+ phosphorylase [Legionella sp. 29fVS95]|uniref:RES family NAD+ phosphorylase n=1 Tax=Legionella sp. 29fVS95 TaxID=3402813 RepID=UPI003AF5BD8C
MFLSMVLLWPASLRWSYESSLVSGDEVNYIRGRETARRVAGEGHPLLRVPSVRHQEGVNLVAFDASVLSNSREYCKLYDNLNASSREIRIFGEMTNC